MKTKTSLMLIISLALCACMISCGTTEKAGVGKTAAEVPVYEPVVVAREDMVPQLPVIRINSTKNGGSNDFVSEPVAKHVKEAQMSWWDFSNKDKPDPWYEECVISTEDSDGSVLLDGAAAQVKVRGNWTTNYAKKSFRIKFDKKQTMLGLNNGGKYKNWVLLACWKDASLMRDAAAFKMFSTMFSDYYSSDAKLVELYINNEYWGVYLLAEQQETKEGRIEVAEVEKNYTGTDIGYLIEFDSYYTTEALNEQFEIDYQNVEGYEGIKGYDDKRIKEQLQRGYTIKSDVYDEAQKTFIQSYMNDVWKICYAAAYKNKYYQFTDDYQLVEYVPDGKTEDEKCQNCISKIIDLKSLADMYIFNEIVCDPDIYLTSFFMDIDFSESGDKILRFEAPWDFDSTMGNKRHCADGQGMFAGVTGYEVNYQKTGTGNPWMFIFIRCGWFQKLVKDEWNIAKATDPAGTAEYLILSYADCASSFENNRSRWGNPSEDAELCEASSAAAATSQKASAEYLTRWLRIRIAAVDQIISDF